MSAATSAMPSGVRRAVARKKLASASRKSLPEEVSSARVNASHGSSSFTNERMRRWYTYTAFGQRLIGNSLFTRRMSQKRMLQ